VCKLVRDAGIAQLVLAGDSRQTVCAYQGADARYLTHAPLLIPWRGPWRRLTLAKSWRLTPAMAAYINEAVVYAAGPPAMRVGARRARPVSIVQGAKFACVHVAAQAVFDYVFVAAYRPEDVLVLATKTSFGNGGGKPTPVQVLVNLLCERLLVYVRSDEHDRAQRAELSKGKVLVSTIVAAKGAERKVVVFLDHDEGYFKYYARDESDAACTCAQHVALTRASEVLVLCSDQNGPPGFVRRCAMRKLESEGKLRTVTAGCQRQPREARAETRPDTVTALLAHVSEHDLARLEATLPFVLVRAASETPLVLPSVCAGAWCESVSETNGIALPALLDLGWMRGQLAALGTATQQPPGHGEGGIWRRAAALAATAPEAVLDAATPRAAWDASVAWALEGAAVLRASPAMGGFVCHYTQLAFSRFAWLPTETAMRVHAALRAETGAGALELEVERDRDGVCGRLDALDALGGGTVFEFKCVSGALTSSHRLQLALYAWLCAARGARFAPARYVLFNPLSGEKWELGAADDEALTATVRALRELRLTPSGRVSDEEFVETGRRLGAGECAMLEGMVGRLGKAARG
jgi:hypothetical protein